MEQQSQPLTVTELTAQLQDCLQAEFSGLWVLGEISDLSRPQSGHCYFTLKDGNARLSAVMWRNAFTRLRFPLEDGMQILCLGGIDIYPPRGSYQLVVRQLEPRGEGDLQRALRQLQAKLQREGLFDAARKRPLPRFPRRVAVITSPTGAAVRDFLEVARRRWTNTEVVILPVRVQGAGCAEEVAQAIRQAERWPVPFDVLVVTRGGGSMEDLWGFNEEALVRAIYKSSVPVVSAVGHEIDVTLSDLVADVRALTPSEAAERVLPQTADVLETLAHLHGRMTTAVTSRWQQARQRVEHLASRPVLQRPAERLWLLSQRLDELDKRCQLAVHHCVDASQNRLGRLAGRLEALSPLAVLQRGYSMTQTADGNMARSVDQLQVGDEVYTRLTDGKIVSTVSRIIPELPSSQEGRTKESTRT